MPTTMADSPSSSAARRAISCATRSGPFVAVDRQRRQRARQRAGGVADRQPDAAAADVDAENAHEAECYNFLPQNTCETCRCCSARRARLLPGALFAGQLPDRARTEALAARAAERLQALHDEADRLATEERTLLRDLRQLELSRQIKTEELRQSDAEARQAASELAAIDAEIRRLEQQEQAEGAGAARAARGVVQARPGPLSADDALHLRRAAPRGGRADGRGAGSPRPRPRRRVTSADATPWRPLGHSSANGPFAWRRCARTPRRLESRPTVPSRIATPSSKASTGSAISTRSWRAS